MQFHIPLFAVSDRDFQLIVILKSFHLKPFSEREQMVEDMEKAREEEKATKYQDVETRKAHQVELASQVLLRVFSLLRFS